LSARTLPISTQRANQRAKTSRRQAPAGTDADYFILSFAQELRTGIVSDDRFRDRIKQFPEAKDRVIR
jgi:hypothetical protein